MSSFPIDFFAHRELECVKIVTVRDGQSQKAVFVYATTCYCQRRFLIRYKVDMKQFIWSKIMVKVWWVLRFNHFVTLGLLSNKICLICNVFFCLPSVPILFLRLPNIFCFHSVHAYTGSRIVRSSMNEFEFEWCSCNLRVRLENITCELCKLFDSLEIPTILRVDVVLGGVCNGM